MHQFAPFNHVKTCRYGTMVFNTFDRYLGRGLDLYGEFSEGEVEMFRQLVRPGDTVLDVGANIGAHTLFFARQVGPKGAIYALEPQRVVFQTLCANMALNSVTNVWCLPCAAGAEPGETTVPRGDYTQSGNFGGVSVGGSAQGERVPVVTVDGLNLPACRLIKIDVEGAEEHVLRGAVQTIERLRPVLYVENDRKERSGGLVRFIAGLGYGSTGTVRVFTTLGTTPAIPRTCSATWCRSTWSAFLATTTGKSMDSNPSRSRRRESSVVLRSQGLKRGQDVLHDQGGQIPFQQQCAGRFWSSTVFHNSLWKVHKSKHFHATNDLPRKTTCGKIPLENMGVRCVFQGFSVCLLSGWLWVQVPPGVLTDKSSCRLFSTLSASDGFCSRFGRAIQEPIRANGFKLCLGHGFIHGSICHDNNTCVIQIAIPLEGKEASATQGNLDCVLLLLDKCADHPGILLSVKILPEPF